MPLITAEQMRELEQAAVRAGASEQELMAAAGLAAAQEAWMAAGAVEGRALLVLVGPGNNGGDGLVAAHHLSEMGAQVGIYMLAARDDDDPLWRTVIEDDIPATGVAVDDEALSNLESMLGQSSLVLDALLGTGASRPIEGDLAKVMGRLREARERELPPQLIALDVPTGVNADTGHVDPAAVVADSTLAFGFSKVGLFTMPGRSYAGRVVPIDIGLPAELGADLPYEEIGFRQTQELLPERPDDAHKGSFGRVVVAAGSRRFPGAARLAAEAAARSGAGLVVLAAAESIQPLLVHGLPDVVHEPLPSTDGTLDGDAARSLLPGLAGADSLLVGPGLSLTVESEEFVRTLLAGLDQVAVDEGGVLRAVVLDADALNALAASPGWHERLSLPRVLTPHPGEMARLIGVTTEEVQRDRLHHATEYAAATGSVVVLKGACTIVAAPDGRARISGAANAMLATAGTGDVLAGMIAGLVAQGLEPFDAASAAVYLHAESGRLVAEGYGAAAGLAQDLLRLMPETRRLLDGG
jgi:NAD(P)H-hydrate epimerase